MSVLEIAEGKLYQGIDEEVPYNITTTPWLSSPTGPTVVVYDEQDESDVTSSVGAITATTSGDVITMSVLKSLTLGHSYRIEVKFTVGSGIYEFKMWVEAIQ